MKNKKLLSGFILLGIILFVLDICLGVVQIPIRDTFQVLIGNNASKLTWQYIIFNFRLPKALVAITVGAALPICGLLMQTLFKNPLAGPYILGLSSGSSLMVAFVIMGSSYLPSFLIPFFISTYGIAIASIIGSLIVLIAVILTAQKIKNTMSILVIGLMFSHFTSSIINILSYFSSAEQLQKFTIWSMGSLGNVSWHNLYFILIICGFTLLYTIKLLKNLDALLLGENYAKSLGIPYKKTVYKTILITSILTGVLTAFIGPIAFIGFAIPHISKIIFQDNQHLSLFTTTILTGICIMLLCDILSHNFEVAIPINAITSIIGAPIVVWLLVKKRTFN
ncbi:MULTISPECIES: iron ABC transporter permease [Flavobacterium]|uniref:Hemin transport system permease protein HmuU n=2 Tax=Flavobacterium TaxID=237 RepID=A0A437UEE1_9FLAO|nr:MULTISPECIES: iron ABC transporter permease [Flavobacterium]OWP84556.1 iron ABC transporter [Flavobacterium davisii]QYS88524.1 iron ABC transporter permease [Flavobacterium davisii]RVU91955.1 iron ABC transporter permease [Flavobacterium columnare]SPE77142.1 Hemin transport system permease protein HmuU [Flavobacterium columnare]